MLMCVCVRARVLECMSVTSSRRVFIATNAVSVSMCA